MCLYPHFFLTFTSSIILKKGNQDMPDYLLPFFPKTYTDIRVCMRMRRPQNQTSGNKEN